VKGREFDAGDRGDSLPVAVVNETMAGRYWPGRDAVGGRFRLGERWLTVVGVARNATYRQVGERPDPWFFLPLEQGFRPDMTLLVRTGGDPAALTRPVLDLLRGLDPQVAPFNVTTLAAFIGAADFRQRAGSQLLGLFGALGLLLACVGLYGVLSFSVARRTREIGIRMALGSDQRDVFRLVLGQGARLALLGLVLGTGAAALLSGLLRGLLVGLSPWDPAAFLAVTVLLLASSFVACAVPARRATRVDPATALRQE
jgi:predicted permease